MQIINYNQIIILKQLFLYKLYIFIIVIIELLLLLKHLRWQW